MASGRTPGRRGMYEMRWISSARADDARPKPPRRPAAPAARRAQIVAMVAPQHPPGPAARATAPRRRRARPASPRPRRTRPTTGVAAAAAPARRDRRRAPALHAARREPPRHARLDQRHRRDARPRVERQQPAARRLRHDLGHGVAQRPLRAAVPDQFPRRELERVAHGERHAHGEDDGARGARRARVFPIISRPGPARTAPRRPRPRALGDSCSPAPSTRVGRSRSRASARTCRRQTTSDSTAATTALRTPWAVARNANAVPGLLLSSSFLAALRIAWAAAAAPAEPTATKQASLAAVRWGGVRDLIFNKSRFSSSPPVVLLGALSGLDVYCTQSFLKPWVIRGRSLRWVILSYSNDNSRRLSRYFASCELGCGMYVRRHRSVGFH